MNWDDIVFIILKIMPPITVVIIRLGLNWIFRFIELIGTYTKFVKSYPGNGFQHSNCTSLTVTTAHIKSHAKSSLHRLIFKSQLNSLPSLLNHLRLPSQEIPWNIFSAELSWAELYVTTDGLPASLSWNNAPIWGLRPDLYYLYDNYGLVLVGRPLWREDGSVLHIWRWPLPAQSFFGPSPFGLATIFYCLRFETSLFVASYDSQGHGGSIRSRLHMGMTFFSVGVGCSLYSLGADLQKTPFLSL
jgi:hypothetical protein